ncbi:MAG: alpha-1,2-fucosyltransferase [Bacteroidetes bacterium]|nr:alpha-1,2-fucosyltransferase [Bacteroidota bacterium]MCA6444964.1 alpha-1,2-fucosyltransferase [Bacteroidota bacterium]
MIIVKIHSGLGNQLFQYAFAKSLSLSLDRELKLDLSQIKKQESVAGKSMYRLDKYKINQEVLDDNELDKILRLSKGWFSGNKVSNFLKKRMGYYSKNDFVVNEARYDLVKQNIDKLEFIYLDGYWGDQKYFELNYDRFKNDFEINEELDLDNYSLKNEIINKNSIGIHVRRGDYLLHKELFTILDKEYYEKAIEFVKSKVNNPVFYVFSDDRAGAKELLNNLLVNDKVIFVNNNNGSKDYLDLELMRSCKHFIMANSTFSWWAAWLSSEDKLITYPTNWFSNIKFQLEYENYNGPNKWVRI